MFSDALHHPRASEEQEKQLAVLHPTPKTRPQNKSYDSRKPLTPQASSSKQLPRSQVSQVWKHATLMERIPSTSISWRNSSSS